MAFTSETVSKGHVYPDTVVTDVGDVVLSGGTMLIEAGAIATSTTVNAGGVLIVEAGGTEIGLTNTGTTDGSGGVISGPVVNDGLLEASGTDAYLAIVGSVTNGKSKTVEAAAVGTGGFAELAISGPVTNSGTIEALATAAASNAYVDISGTVDNTSGRIVASGNGVIDIGGATISGGTLQTIGVAAAIAAFPGDSATIAGAAIAPNSLIDDQGGAMNLSAVTFGAHDTLEASDGGTVTLGGGATFSAGTLAEAATGGTLDIDGNISNAGTVEALPGSPETSASVTLSGGFVGNGGSLVALVASTGDSAFLSVDGGTGVTNSGSIIASVTAIYSSAVVTISGGTISNSKIIAAEDIAPNTMAVLLYGGDALTIIDAANITNAGTIEALAVSGGEAAVDATATAISNTGAIKALASSAETASLRLGGAVNNAKAASIVVSATGSNSEAELDGPDFNSATVSNSGTIEALAQSGAYATLDVGGINRGTMLASAGADSTAAMVLGTIDNTSGHILASAGSDATALIVLFGTVSGGVLQAVGTGADITVFPYEAATISGATIAANSHIVVGQNGYGVAPGVLTLDNDTFGAGAALEVTEESTVAINGGLSLSAGALIEVVDDSTASISGNVANAGTIEAVDNAAFFGGEAAISISGDELINTGTIAYLAGPFQNTPVFTIGVTSALVNSGTLEIVDTGPGANLDGNNVGSAAELDVSAGTITNTKRMIASAAMVAGDDADFAALNVYASGGFINSGTVSVVATANLPSGEDVGEDQVFANISAGADFANIGTIATVASSNFPRESLRIDMATTVVSAAGNIGNGGLILASATGFGQTGVTIDLVAGGTFFNSGTVSAARRSLNQGGATVSIQAATILNDKTVAVSLGNMTLEADTITNSGLIETVNGAGLGFIGGTITNARTGTIDVLNSEDTDDADNLVNSGVIRVSAASENSEFIVVNGAVSNAGTIAAWGEAHRGELVLNGAVDNSGGTLLASGNAEIDIDGATISGGTLATSGGMAAILVAAAASISAASIAAGSLAEASGGTLTLGSGTVIGKGATVEAIDGGVIEVTGTLTNSGVLLGDAGGSVVIASGASVSGAAAQIGALGAVVISGDNAENVTFLSGAVSGGLYLADTATDSAGYAGTVSGFGGNNGADSTQFIDLSAVTYSAGLVSTIYTANAAHPASGGALAVISGGVTVADINLAGNYTYAAFEVTSGANNTVAITDPLGTAGTLASTANNASPSTPGTAAGASSLALLGGYMAALFASAESGINTRTTDGVENQAALVHPHTG